MKLVEIENRIDLLDLQKNRIRVVSYNPLCYTKTGVIAYTKYDLKPFVDASCRREPDLENQYPSITAICRKNKFAPHLNKGDIVIYITNKGKYLKDERENYRLVAVLQVIEKCGSHETAADWYKENNIPLPSNCFVQDNSPFPFAMTCGLFKNRDKDLEYFENAYLKITDEVAKDKYEKIALRRWDAYYKSIVKDYPDFIITEKLIDCLDNPIMIRPEDFKKYFGRDKNSRLPFSLNKKSQLLTVLQLAVTHIES